jgi:hypothetical protein
MKEQYYNGGQDAGQESVIYDNIITVAKTYYPNQILTKRIYPGNMVPYDRVKHFNLIPQEVFDFDEVKKLLARATANPRVCLLRAVPIDDDRTPAVNVQRIATPDSIHGPQTIVARPSNLVIIDVDDYGEASGNIEKDAWKILLALNMPYVRCIAIASSSYMVKISGKKGISLRMLFWNEHQITNRDLRAYFSSYSKIVDLALFQPGQLIYVANPVFVGCPDPVPNRMIEINPQGITTDIPHNVVLYHRGGYSNNQYDFYTKADAKRVSRSWWHKIATAEYQGDPSRHVVLFEASCVLGKLAGKDLLTEDEAREMLMDACDQWGSDNRDPAKDADTIHDGLKRGQRETEGNSF